MKKLMKFFGERRSAIRTKVDWSASLRCIFADAEQTAHGKIADISVKGARITLEKLQLGSHHVLISDQPVSYELSIPLPEGDLKIPVEIRWYNLDEKSRFFFLALQFISLSNEEKKRLQQAIENV